MKDGEPASFEGAEGTLMGFAVDTAGAEAPEPRTHAEAANVERHRSHQITREGRPQLSRVGGVNLDGPEPTPTSTDHSVTFPIDRAPASATAHAMTCDVPYREAVRIPFAPTSGPTHSDSVKRIPVTFSDTPDPPSTHAEENSPLEGSANANGRTAEDGCAKSGHAFFIDGGTPLNCRSGRTPLPRPPPSATTSQRRTAT